MIGRSSRILFEVLAGLVGVTVLLVAAAAWRLSQGPVSLAFAVPYVHERLVEADGPFAIELDDIILTWAGWRRTLDIRVLGVTVRDRDNRDGGIVAAVPEISVSLALAPLARGEIVPTRLEVIGPRLRLHRTKAGEFRLAVGEQAGPTGETLRLMLDTLLAPREGDSPLAALAQISIVGGDLSVDDRLLGTTWRAPRLDIVLARDNGGLSARFDLDAALERQTPHLSGTARYDAAKGTIDVEGRIHGVRPNLLARQFAVLAPLEGLALPIDAEFEARLTADGVLRGGRFRLSAGRGALRYPDLVPRAVAVRSAVARGSFDVAASRIVLDEAKLDLGGPTIGLSGVYVRTGGKAAISGEAVVRKIPLAEFKSYWPKKGNTALRGWIAENLEDGQVAEARVRLRAQSRRSAEWALDDIGATMRLQGVTIHYLKPLIPIREVGASITFVPGRVDVTIDGGDLNGLGVDTATIAILDDGAGNWTLALDTVLRGEVRNALEILDHPRLKYASDLGIDVARVAGRSAIRMRVELPLEPDLELDRVDMRAAASLADVDVPGAFFGRDIRDGALTVQVDRGGMTVSGTARLAEIPATIMWYENFADDAPFVRRYDVKATLDDEARRRLGLDTAPFLSGPVAADIVLIVKSDAESELIGRFALDRATLALARLDWSKPAGTPGEARLEIVLAGERIAAVRRFDIRAAGLVARGEIAFADDGVTIRRAEFERFAIGERTEISGIAVRRSDGGFDVSISGAALDGETLRNTEAEAGAQLPALPAMRLTAKIDRLWIEADAKIDAAEIVAEYDGAMWRRVTATGRTSGGHRIDARYRADARGQRLAVDSNDAGALLRTLDVADIITGGRLVLEASKAALDGPAPWRGRVVVRDFRVAKAPILARLLTLASLTGISDLASGKGISFKRLDIPFAMRSGRLTISDARAVGSEIGITSSGEIDLEGDSTRLEGNVVPAYTLNTLVGRIPILGDIITGGKGGGVFAVAYSVSGPLDDPKIRVNPLTALAPGFLRNLLRGLGKAGTDRPPEPEPEE